MRHEYPPPSLPRPPPLCSPILQSGDPIGDNNPPLALPNGRVYGSRAIRAMARPVGGIDGIGSVGVIGNSVVTCPSTGKSFRFDQLRNVYII